MAIGSKSTELSSVDKEVLAQVKSIIGNSAVDFAPTESKGIEEVVILGQCQKNNNELEKA